MRRARQTEIMDEKLITDNAAAVGAKLGAKRAEDLRAREGATINSFPFRQNKHLSNDDINVYNHVVYAE